MSDVTSVNAGGSLPRPVGFEPPPIGLRSAAPAADESPPPAKPVAVQPEAPPKPDDGAEQQLRRALERSATPQFNYRYGVRERTGDFYVQVLDARTREVNKTIPIEELLDLRERIQDQVGLILDQRA